MWQHLGKLLLLSLLTACVSSSNPYRSDIAAMAAHAHKNLQQEAENPLRIVVIGAGAAGLAAAWKLQRAGHQVIVLEARERIGGRIWSHTSEQGQVVDLGAAWIHGTNNNPVFQLASAQQLPLAATDYDNLVLRNQPDTQYINGEELERLASEINLALQTTPSSQQRSVASVLDDLATPSSVDKLNFAAELLIEQEFAAPLEEMSVYALEEGAEPFDGEDMLFPNGYVHIFDNMIKGLDIRLQSPVTEISYQGTTIQITTANQPDYFEAEKVLVTVSLGVLQKRKISFTPPLPESKLSAIDALGMGVFNKVYLSFPKVFWEEDKDLITHFSASNRQWPSFLNLYKHHGDRALVAITTAQQAIAMESKSDPQIINELMQLLRQQYGSHIPEPNSIKVTRWHRDPYAHGAYSFMKVGASSQSRQELAESVANRLYFAGEATSINHPATVHGALLSGLREADKILNNIANSPE